MTTLRGDGRDTLSRCRGSRVVTVMGHVSPDLAGIRQGDAVAFERVYEEVRPRLFSFLVRLSRRRDVAEDLLEETWLRLVTHAHDLPDDTCLPAWLFTVARRLFVSWCRHRAIDADRIWDLTPSWPAPARGETPFEAAARSETERRLERGLARLAQADREVLLLVGVEGFTPSQAATVLGLAPEAFRKRLQRARARLTAEMATMPAPGAGTGESHGDGRNDRGDRR